jgi:hypothetical protein
MSDRARIGHTQGDENRLKSKGFADCGKTHVLYQGTTLVGPLGIENVGL